MISPRRLNFHRCDVAMAEMSIPFHPPFPLLAINLLAIIVEVGVYHYRDFS